MILDSSRTSNRRRTSKMDIVYTPPSIPLNNNNLEGLINLDVNSRLDNNAVPITRAANGGGSISNTPTTLNTLSKTT